MALQGEGDDVTIDFNVLATELQSMISSADSSESSNRNCIFRVPDILLRQNPKAYTPNAFSIGPFHYDKPQEIKLQYLNDFISRFRESRETALRKHATIISKVGEEARQCYAGPIDMSMSEFKKVLVLDGCFISELFSKLRARDYKDRDPVFSSISVQQLLNHDLMLLENQIPWLVLEPLFSLSDTFYDAQGIPLHERVPLYEMMELFFDDIFSTQLLLSHRKNCEFKHFLDLVRSSAIVD
ncbi:hypothetical protein PanWU01x14_125930 [Parasponia andersonii]|uniref:Uncharacterized protein n=1 Tax=Parasponia andersonii TaxID=3476 RepID=A0A2P5CTA3_PARAD|nr:hypothetical protein PanWU01x14_125930 [Parasponia andersonii]